MKPLTSVPLSERLTFLIPLSTIFFFHFASLSAQPLDLKVSGERVILINGESGAVLFEKNCDQQCYPASTTKIATALYALHLRGNDLSTKMTTRTEAICSISPQAKVQSKYRSPPHWLETDGSHIGLKKGEEMPLHDLIHAILICSANDACNVVAQNLAGSVPKFMEHLNHYLKQIGCKNTHFNNPHGLSHPDHVTTARDLSIMAKEALSQPFFCEVMKKTKYTCPETNLEYQRFFIQTNQLLKKTPYYYPQAIGMKTGTTKAAGKNLVAVAEENGRVLIGVFMGYPSSADLYSDAKRVFETAFKEQKMRRTLLSAGSQEFTKEVSGTRKRLETYLPEKFTYEYYPSEDQGFRLLVHWKLPKLPIVKGAEVGRLEIVGPNHKVLKSTTLYANNSLSQTLWSRLVFGKTIFLALAIIPLLWVGLRFRKK